MPPKNDPPRLNRDDIDLLIEALDALSEKIEAGLKADQFKEMTRIPASFGEFIQLLGSLRSPKRSPAQERIILMQAKLIQMRDRLEILGFINEEESEESNGDT